MKKATAALLLVVPSVLFVIGCSRPPNAFGQHMLIQPCDASAFMNARELAPEP